MFYRRPIERLIPLALSLLVLLALTVGACGAAETDTSTSPVAAAEDVPVVPEDGPTSDDPAPAFDDRAEGGGEASGDEAPPPPDGDADPSAAPSTVPLPERVEAPADLRIALTPLLELDQPVALAPQPDSDLLYVAEQAGRLQIVRPGADAASTELIGTALDLSARVSTGNEQGLLGVVFSPDGERMFVDFTDTNGTTTIAEYQVVDGRPDPATERIVMTVAQPRENHNAGDLHFGPDGHLYITLGDGGGGGDPEANGQNTDTVLGSVLRIVPDQTGSSPYAVPGSNPFAERGGRPEIYLYGVRNPWKISFDRATGDLWVADVGQKDREEVNVLYASDGAGRGANLGWDALEGTTVYDGATPPRDAVPPLYEYTHDEGCSVTGGYVYRGTAITDLRGIYVFGDYCTSRLWGLVSSERQGLVGRIDLGVEVPPTSLVGFGQDNNGELYVLSAAGTVSRIDPG